MQRTNRLKELLASGQVALGGQLRFGSAAIAELFGLAGYDFVLIDGEHAPQTPVGVQAQLQAVGCTQATPIVRLPRNDPDLIRLYLDMGAMGIVVPFVNTAKEAELGAKACRYPPAGTRGFGPARAAAYGFDADYFRRINDHILYIPIIETAEAIENIDEIVAVPGVDSFIVGPVDLGISLGVPFQWEDRKFRGALEKVAQAARKAGKPAGIGVWEDAFATETFERLIGQGFTLFIAGGDEWFLQAACRKAIGAFANARG